MQKALKPTSSPGMVVVLRMLAREKSASCHVGVRGRWGGGRKVGICSPIRRPCVFELAVAGGKKAESPSGPEAVTRAMMTECQVESHKRALLTAVSASRILEGQALEHVRAANVFGLSPERTKAAVKIKCALVINGRIGLALQQRWHMTIERA